MSPATRPGEGHHDLLLPVGYLGFAVEAVSL